MAEPKVVTAIDVGSSKIVTLVGEAAESTALRQQAGEFSVIGVGIVPSRGVKRGQMYQCERRHRGHSRAWTARAFVGDEDHQRYHQHLGQPHRFAE